jgi:hypothetical protein
VFRLYRNAVLIQKDQPLRLHLKIANNKKRY